MRMDEVPNAGKFNPLHRLAIACCSLPSLLTDPEICHTTDLDGGGSPQCRMARVQ